MRKQKLLAIITLIAGSTLEIWYYIARFTAEGASLRLSIIQSVALTCFLMVAFILREKSRLAWLVIVPVALYSIFNTAAGNRSNLIVKAESQIVSINTDQIEELEKKLDRKNAAYEADFQIVQFESIEDRAKWRTTAGQVKDNLDAKESEIDDIENQIIALKNPDMEESDISGIYEFYSSRLPIKADTLQMITQFMLSFFIAMMAPSALLLWPTITTAETDWDHLVREWVHTNWTGIRNGQTRSILSKEKFLEFKRSRGVVFTPDQYDAIKKASIKVKVVDKDGITEDNEIIAIEAILRRLNA